MERYTLLVIYLIINCPKNQGRIENFYDVQLIVR